MNIALLKLGQKRIFHYNDREAYNYRTKKLQKENEIRIFENRSRRSYHAPKSYNEGKELKEIISYSGMRFREEVYLQFILEINRKT